MGTGIAASSRRPIHKVAPGKDGKPGPTPIADVPMALYDLTHDPGTVYDVQKQYPEIVEEMLKYVEQAREDLGDDLDQKKRKEYS